MKEFIQHIKHQLEITIKHLETQEENPLSRIKQTVQAIEASIYQLKSFTETYTFKSQEEEILFFKVQKPEIYSQLLYHVRLYNIENKRSGKSEFAQSVYLHKELQRLTQATEYPDNFYQYYRSGKSSSDTLYFIRDTYDVLSDISCQSFDKDRFFSTSHDHVVADIMANDLLKNYLTRETEKMNSKLHYQMMTIISDNKMQWTESKAALVELIYAIYSYKCINYGNISLKDIASYAETIFHVEIGDFYRTFLEIRNRKKNRTQFLDEIKNNLIQLMDNLDK